MKRSILVGLGLTSGVAAARILAGRVVASPLNGKVEQRPAAVEHAGPGQVIPGVVMPPVRVAYAELLRLHVEEQYRHHLAELSMARRLRRRGDQMAAAIRLGDERLGHARAACNLNRAFVPELGGAMRQRFDQLRLELWYDRRRSHWTRQPLPFSLDDVSERRVPRWTALWVWVTGGPRTGPAHELVEFHRQEVRHYRESRKRARRCLREHLEAQARNLLFHEFGYHFRRSYAPSERVDRW